MFFTLREMLDSAITSRGMNRGITGSVSVELYVTYINAAFNLKFNAFNSMSRLVPWISFKIETMAESENKIAQCYFAMQSISESCFRI